LIPEALDGWTLDVLHALVEQGVFETDRFDFKEMLPHTKDDDGKRRLRKDSAAFANSAGGFFVFGIKNDKGLPAADRLVGLRATGDFPEQFGNYPSTCEPSVEWTFKNPAIPLLNGNVVHVVHVPSSPRRPHGILDDGRWWFCKRTNKGTETMSHAELRAAFSATREKVAKLHAIIAELQYLRDRAQEVNAQASQSGPAAWWRDVPAYEYSTIAALLPDVLELVSDCVIGWIPELRNAVRRAEEEREAALLLSGGWIAVGAYTTGARHVLNVADRLLPFLRKAETDVHR